MIQEKSRNSSGRARDCLMEQNEIFCEEIRKFIHESRKSQTVYTNFEGFHERTVKYNELNKLDDLVFLTLSDGKDRASQTCDEFEETNKLAQLMVKKIYNSCKKFKCSDIRLHIVWIYYFDYLEKEMKAMPIFKIYKKNQGSEAFYIDISVFEYDSWDHFIMFYQFPASFICIPRRGEYTFRNIDGEDLLDLEYICKNSQLRNKLLRSFRPFSQTVIQKVLHKVVPFMRVVIPFLKTAITFAEICGMHTHPKVALFVIVINVMGILLRILELEYGGNESQEAMESTAADCSLMLLNDDEGKLPWKKCLSVLNNVVERSLKDKIWAAVTDFTENPRDNFVKVLKLVPEIIEVCEPLYVSFLGDKGPFLRIFLQSLSILSSQGTEENKIQENKIKKKSKKIQKKRKESEESEKGLCNLEKYSCEKVFSELCSKDVLVDQAFRDLQKFGFDLFGFKVYLLVKHTTAGCKNFLQNLLKSNYTLEEGVPCLNIMLNGNLIGVVIPFSFQSVNLSIIALRLDKLPEVNN